MYKSSEVVALYDYIPDKYGILQFSTSKVARMISKNIVD